MFAKLHSSDVLHLQPGTVFPSAAHLDLERHQDIAANPGVTHDEEGVVPPASGVRPEAELHQLPLLLQSEFALSICHLHMWIGRSRGFQRSHLCVQRHSYVKRKPCDDRKSVLTCRDFSAADPLVPSTELLPFAPLLLAAACSRQHLEQSTPPTAAVAQAVLLASRQHLKTGRCSNMAV